MEVLLALRQELRLDTPYFPPQIPSRLCYGKDYPYSRIGDVVEMVKKEGARHKYSTLKITKKVLQEIPEDQIYTLSSSNEFFYVRGKGLRFSQIYKIQNISTSEPWTILDMHGGERVVYLGADTEGYELVDSQLNYYKEK